MEVILKNDGTGLAYNHIVRYDYDIFAIIETKRRAKPPSIRGYFYFFVPASSTNGGGIAVYIKNKFKFLASVASKDAKLNSLWVKIRGKRDVFFNFAYCPTDNFALK